MRTSMTAAAVAGLLLLSGCSVAGAQAGESDSTPSPSGESRIDLSAPDTEIALSQEYDVIGGCDAFFGGRNPLSAEVRELAPAIAQPLDPTSTKAEVSKMSNQISSLIGLSPQELTLPLERIRTPFDQAKQGSLARPQDVATGIQAFEAVCAEAGWTSST